jgi:cytochrome c553
VTRCRVLPAISALIALAVVSATASGEDARGLAAACAGCHGTDGHASAGMPVLAGHERGTLGQRMRAFRDGRAVGTVMPQLAKGYTDAQIDALDAWFAAQPRTPTR